MDAAWNPETFPIFENPKIQYCLAHWRDGESWEDSGAVDFHMEAIEKRGEIDHCRNIHDVNERLRGLDVIWQNVVRDRRLMSARQTSKYGFREVGGIFVHLGPKGQPIFGGGGNHRLGIAIAAELEIIPCQVGAVHPDGLKVLTELI